MSDAVGVKSTDEANCKRSDGCGSGFLVRTRSTHLPATDARLSFALIVRWPARLASSITVLFLMGAFAGGLVSLGCGSSETAALDRSVGAKGSVLVHDFQVVRPAAKYTHSFRVENNTSKNWRIKKVGTTCQCTLAKLYPAEIRPGEAEMIEVEYTAPSVPGREEKAVWLFFEDETIDPVGLVVRATTKERIEVTKRLITLRVHSSQLDVKEMESQFDIINRSEEKIDKLRLVSDEEWLVGDYGPMPSHGESEQTFRVLAIIYPGKLLAGINRATLRVERVPHSGPGPSLLTVVPVEITVIPELEMHPHGLFFGRLTRGDEAEASMRLKVNAPSGIKKLRVADFALPGNLRSCLTLSLDYEGKGQWILSGLLKTQELSGLVQGDLEMKPSGEGEVIGIPVNALVIEDES